MFSRFDVAGLLEDRLRSGGLYSRFQTHPSVTMHRLDRFANDRPSVPAVVSLATAAFLQDCEPVLERAHAFLDGHPGKQRQFVDAKPGHRPELVVVDRARRQLQDRGRFFHSAADAEESNDLLFAWPRGNTAYRTDRLGRQCWEGGLFRDWWQTRSLGQNPATVPETGRWDPRSSPRCRPSLNSNSDFGGPGPGDPNRLLETARLAACGSSVESMQSSGSGLSEASVCT